MTAAELTGCWKGYKSTGQKALFDQLVEHYFPIVKEAAFRLVRKLPRGYDPDDLISEGAFGLMDAVARFDAERGVLFETYVSPKIKGRMLDFLRRNDWVPRLARARQKKVRKEEMHFLATHGRACSDVELCEIVGERTLRWGRPPRTHSLRRLYNRGCDDYRSKDYDPADTSISPPCEGLQAAEFKAAVMRGLTARERVVVELYFFQDVPMRQIAETVGLSESRISQMLNGEKEKPGSRDGIMVRLRQKFANRKEEFV